MKIVTFLVPAIAWDRPVARHCIDGQHCCGEVRRDVTDVIEDRQPEPLPEAPWPASPS